MFKIFIILLIALLSPSLYADDFNQSIRSFLIEWEGIKSIPYRCSSNRWTVGIGHNLDAHRQSIQSRYTPEQIERFFRDDLDEAVAIARSGVDHFDELPEEVRLVVISLVWTVGRQGFTKFVNFRLALSKGNYQDAARQLKQSKWYYQVGKARSINHINILLSLNR